MQSGYQRHLPKEDITTLTQSTYSTFLAHYAISPQENYWQLG